MRYIRSKRPSPAMIIAVAALVAALGGSAVAEIATTSLNKGEKKQIRKIAKKIANKQANTQITRRAPGLTVASAKSADSANTANTANSANSANSSNSANSANSANTANTANKATNADQAANADTVAGATIRKFDFRKSSTTPATEILNVGGLKLAASCTTGTFPPPFPFPFAVVNVVASTSEADASLQSISHSLNSDGAVNGSDDGNSTNDDFFSSNENINDVNLIDGFGTGAGDTNNVSLVPDFGDGPGTAHFRTSTGGIVVVHWTALDGVFAPCVFNGYAVSG